MQSMGLSHVGITLSHTKEGAGMDLGSSGAQDESSLEEKNGSLLLRKFSSRQGSASQNHERLVKLLRFFVCGSNCGV